VNPVILHSQLEELRLTEVARVLETRAEQAVKLQWSSSFWDSC